MKSLQNNHSSTAVYCKRNVFKIFEYIDIFIYFTLSNITELFVKIKKSADFHELTHLSRPSRNEYIKRYVLIIQLSH